MVTLGTVIVIDGSQQGQVHCDSVSPGFSGRTLPRKRAHGCQSECGTAHAAPWSHSNWFKLSSAVLLYGPCVSFHFCLPSSASSCLAGRRLPKFGKKGPVTF